MDVVTYLLSKKYVDDTLQGAGALVGKSAYQIAVDNGFKGTEKDWLNSLIGATPTIGPAGTWFIGDQDTGVIASPSLAGYATEEFVNQQIASIPDIDLSLYATRQELNEALLGIKIPNLDNFVTYEELNRVISEIVIPDIDLSNYVTQEEIANLPTKEYVQEKIAEIEFDGEIGNITIINGGTA